MTTGLPLAQSTGRSAIWQLVGGSWQTLVRLGASIFLARTLKPEDFGLFGLALLVQAFVTNAGAFDMSAGIIARKHLTDDDICTCFWTMTSVRCTLFLICYFGASTAAWFFTEPRLTKVLQVVSLSLLISILEAVSQTLIIRNLQFGTLNVIRGCSILLESTLAIVLALYTDLQYWSLVCAMMASYLFSGSIIFASARWIPKFRFNRESFKYFFRFGINGLGSSIIGYLSHNFDYISVGRLLGANQLGLYEFAYRIPHLIHERVSQPVQAVIFPSLSKLQTDDSQMAYAYEKAVKYIALITFPALLGLAAIADIGIPVLWGAQWTSIVGPMRILCICSLLRSMPQGIGSVFYCKDRPDLPFKVGLWGLFWTALCVGSLGYLWGLYGVASGMVLSVLPNFYMLWLAYRMMNLSLSSMFHAISHVLGASMASIFAVYIIKIFLLHINISLSLTLGLSILAGVVTYPLIIYQFFPKLFVDILETFQTISGRKLPSTLLEFATRRASHRIVS